MKARRGYFGIACYQPKTTDNVGTLWRSAHVFGAAFVATIGARYHRQPSDTMQTPRHVPLLHFATVGDLLESVQGATLIGVELCERARNLVTYNHAESAVYLLGPEDGSLPPDVLGLCRSVVQIPGTHCLNLAVAGSIVAYDRVAKSGVQSLT